MMTRIRTEIPHNGVNPETLKQILTPSNIKNLNQSEKMQILELIEKMLENYNLTEVNLIIDELLKNLVINDYFTLKIIYYKVKKELLCLNVVEANKYIDLGLDKIKNIEVNDPKFHTANQSFTIEKHKCDYLSGVYKESLEYYTSFERKFDLDQLIKIEVFLNIGSIYLLTGDIQSGINIYKNSFTFAKQVDKPFLLIKISHLLGDYYGKIGNFEDSMNFYKLSLSYSEDQENIYYIGKTLAKLFIMPYFQESITIDDFLLLKFEDYQKRVLKSNYFSKIISIYLSDELKEKITRLKSLIGEFNDQIVEPDILIFSIESLILFQLTILKEEYSDAVVDDLDKSIVSLENASKKYSLIFDRYKSLLLKSKIIILKQNFSQAIQILRDGIVSADKLKLQAYSKFFNLEIEKINLLSPLYQPTKNNPNVAEILHTQQIFQLMEIITNFSYRLSLI